MNMSSLDTVAVQGSVFMFSDTLNHENRMSNQNLVFIIGFGWAF